MSEAFSEKRTAHGPVYPIDRRSVSRFVFLLVAVLLSGCDDSPKAPENRPNSAQITESPQATSMQESCSMLTQEEASAILGERVGVPRVEVVSSGSEQTAAVSQCTFNAAATPAKSFTILTRRSPKKDNDPAGTRRNLNEVNIPTREVSGVGDAAFWGSFQLHTFKDGNVYLVISVFGFPDEEQALEKAKAIAERTLTRF